MPANNNTNWLNQVAFNALDLNFNATPVQMVYEPPRGPHEPNTFLPIIAAPDGGVDFLIRKATHSGHESHLFYATEDELRQLGPHIMAWLAKKEADARTADAPSG